MERLTIPDVRIDKSTTCRSIIDSEKVKECAMEIYWRLKAIEDVIADKESEEYCLDCLQELQERAEKAEREKDAALKDLEEAAWCQHCINWKDMNACLQLVKNEGHVRLCVLCKRKCTCRDCEGRSKWIWRGERRNACGHSETDSRVQNAGGKSESTGEQE